MVVGDPGRSAARYKRLHCRTHLLRETWPDGKPCPCGEVLLVNGGGRPFDIRPRLDAAGAIAERVHWMGYQIVGNGRTRSFNLADVEAIDEFISRHPEIRLGSY